MRSAPAKVVLVILATTLTGCVTGLPEAEVADLYFKLGSAYFELGQYDNSVSSYSQALKLDSTLVKAGYNLAHVYLETGRIDDAKQMLENLLADEPENTVLLSTLAWARYREADLQGALLLYEQVLDRLEGDADTLFNTATVLWELDRFAEALSRFLELLEIDESPENIRAIAELYRATDEIDSAILYFELFVELEPTSIDERVALAELYSEARDFGKSVAMYDEVAQLSEVTPAHVYFARARILLESIEDYTEGVHSLDDALAAGFADLEAVTAIAELVPADVAHEIELLVERFDLQPAVRADSAPAPEIELTN